MSTRPSPSKEPTMERLILIPIDRKPGRFSAYLQRTGAPVVTGSKQPLVDGARELLARGFDPGMLLTMRHEGSAHDSFQPLPIGRWAAWTYEERDNGGLTCARWMPFASPGYPKVDLRAVGFTQTYPPAEATVRSDIPDSRLRHLHVNAKSLGRARVESIIA
jgi:hypothetical protein